jgi:hypothetical protein
MTLKQFKKEFRLTDYKYDPWGECMSAWFECAGQMNKRGLYIPHEWQYRPSPLGDCTDPENYWYSIFAHCGKNQLLAIGQLLHRYDQYLRFKGRNY